MARVPAAGRTRGRMAAPRSGRGHCDDHRRRVHLAVLGVFLNGHPDHPDGRGVAAVRRHPGAGQGLVRRLRPGRPRLDAAAGAVRRHQRGDRRTGPVAGAMSLNNTHLAVPIGATIIAWAAARQRRGGTSESRIPGKPGLFSLVPYTAIAATQGLLLWTQRHQPEQATRSCTRPSP